MYSTHGPGRRGTDADPEDVATPSPLSQRSFGEAAVQQAAAAMIADTEAYRQQIREQEAMREHQPLMDAGNESKFADEGPEHRMPDHAMDGDAGRGEHGGGGWDRSPEPAPPTLHMPSSSGKAPGRASVYSIPEPPRAMDEDDFVMPIPPNARRATMHPDHHGFSSPPRWAPSASNRMSYPLPQSSASNRIPRKPIPIDSSMSLMPPGRDTTSLHQHPQPPGSPPPPHVIEFARAVSQFMVQSSSYNNSQYYGRESYYSHNALPAPGHPDGMPPPHLSDPGSPDEPPLKPPPGPVMPPARPDMSLPAEIAFVLMICIAQMLMLAGIAQAMVPVFIIAKTFPETTMSDLAWFSAAYGLTAGTFVLPSGRLGDVFGHKRIFIIGFLWFGVWSLLCGLSPFVQNAGGLGSIYFCICRGFQGLGPAMLVPNGQAMLGRTYGPGPRKNIVMCLFGAAAPLGFVLGAAFSSLFATKSMWSWAFYTLAAVCVALAALSIVCIPSSKPAPRKPGVNMWARLDAPGIFLGVSGLVLFNVAWNQVPVVTFNTPYTYFMMIIAFLLIAAFVYVESISPYPILPVSALTASTNFVLACTATGWGCFSIWIWYLVQFLELERNWSSLGVSAALGPAPVSGLLASLLVGILMRNSVKPHWIMLIAMCAFTVGSVLMATAPVGQIYWANTFVAIAIMPFGMDMSNPAATILVSNSVSREHQGIAASLVVTAVNYAISVSLGMAGAVERHIIDDGGDRLSAFRGAQYFGIGLGGLGMLIGVAFIISSSCHTPRQQPPKAV